MPLFWGDHCHAKAFITLGVFVAQYHLSALWFGCYLPVLGCEGFCVNSDGLAVERAEL